MYAAKNGAGRVASLYRPDIDVHDPSLLSLMGELRQAIDDGDVDIEVEPVVDLAPASWCRPRRWSAGTTRCAAPCGRACSSRSPSATGSSCR